MVDRKFHVGMLEYARRADRPFECLLPRLSPEGSRTAMDLIEVPLAEVPYRIHVLSDLSAGPADMQIIEGAIARAAVAYIGHSEWLNLAVADMCRARKVPYVAISEYTLRTELQIMRASTPSIVRRAYRELRLRGMHRKKLSLVAQAAEVHANGYPTYLELAPINPRRLLYFDTRATASSIITGERLSERLRSRPGRVPRLLYSGRYDPIKGTLDVVKVGIELHRRGVPFRLDLYGTGRLRDEMLALVRGSGTEDKIAIHDPIPYPELVEVARKADVFLCCHVQGDPSCTYLETFACGVPIVGYANEMWSPLCQESGGGEVVALGDVGAMAQAVQGLLGEGERLQEASLKASAHALANTMEHAWDQRVARIVAVADRAQGSAA
jgi:glycosyltransferase involved in cell wall biosynthesis